MARSAKSTLKYRSGTLRRVVELQHVQVPLRRDVERIGPRPIPLASVLGASMLPSRALLDGVGLMAKPHSLYCKQLHWAMRSNIILAIVCGAFALRLSRGNTRHASPAIMSVQQGFTSHV